MVHGFVLLEYSKECFCFSVAEEPTNLSSCWQSNTSLLISWSSPSVTPTGYMIYYKHTNETNYQSDKVPGGGTQNHVLNNLSIEANYSILIQSLSDHLPSKIVGIGDSIISGISYNVYTGILHSCIIIYYVSFFCLTISS